MTTERPTILFEGREYLDDRIFVLDVRRTLTRSLTTGQGGARWSLITRRNVPGLPPFRTDDFPSRQEAIDYLERVEPVTPLVSLGGRPPEPPLPLADYRAWLRSIGARPAHVEPEPDESGIVFEVLSGERLARIIENKQWTLLAWSHHRASVNLTNIACERLRWRVWPHRTPFTLFMSLWDELHSCQLPFPWALVVYDRAYPLVEHLRATRRDPRAIVGSTHIPDHQDGESLSMLLVYSPSALEAVSTVSPLYAEPWQLLCDKDPGEHWLCLPGPLPEEWVEAHAGARHSDDSPT